jgi:hypothetical protein
MMAAAASIAIAGIGIMPASPIADNIYTPACCPADGILNRVARASTKKQKRFFRRRAAG